MEKKSQMQGQTSIWTKITTENIFVAALMWCVMFIMWKLGCQWSDSDDTDDL